MSANPATPLTFVPPSIHSPFTTTTPLTLRPTPLAHSLSRRTPHAPSRPIRNRSSSTAPRASHGANEPPDYDSGFDPSVDADYAEVRAFSFGPSRNGCALLTLYPVSGGPHAFKMSVTAAQADAIRRALSNNRVSARQANSNKSVSGSASPGLQAQGNQNKHQRDRSQSSSNGSQSSSNGSQSIGPGGVYMERPTTHDLTKNIIDACGGVVAQAAITHMVGDVFIARVWIRPPSTSTSTCSLTVDDDAQDGFDECETPCEQLLHVDARPSDALALAARASAPLYLHRGLLAAWGVSAETVRTDAQQGRCELVTYSEERKSASSMREELRGSPEVFGLALLKARLDLAVRLQRFGEAAKIRDHITKICPVDFLSLELKKAVADQRFADAARLQDELTLWRARLRQWEKGTLDLDKWADSHGQGQGGADI